MVLEIILSTYTESRGFGIIGGGGGDWKLTKKINNRGKRMTQKLFWYQYNKGRVKYCQILKAHKFSMIYNCHAEFFSFLCVFLINFVQI